MKIFGIKIRLILLISVGFIQIAFSQDYLDPCLCNRNTCGDIVASFKLVSNSTIVCDGYEFEVQNNSTIPDIKHYIWSWGDGTTDTVMTSANQKHIYNIPIDLLCSDDQTNYLICLLAVKECGTVHSCHNNNSPVTVKHRPLAKFDFSNSVCINKKVDFMNKSCNVDESISDAYLWTFHDGTISSSKNTSKTYTSPGTYTVKLKVKNECGENEITQVIYVVDYPDAVVSISASARDSVVCVGESITLIDRSNQWSSGNYWTFPNNYTILTDTMDWKLDMSIRELEKKLPYDTITRLDTIRFHVLKQGTYTFVLTSKNDCGTKEWTFPLKVVQPPTITLNKPPEFCETANYTPIVNVKGDVSSYTWTFPGGNPSSSNLQNPGLISYNAPGTYTITLKAKSECDTITKSVQLIVNSRDSITITNPNKIYCQSSSPDTLRTDRPGGIWSGTGITDSRLGVFDPSKLSPGSYPITYTIGPVGCQSISNITLQVVASENVFISDTILCENSDIIQLVASPSSGVWSGNPAVTMSGSFDPGISGIGSFSLDYFYQDINGCAIKKKIDVRVEALPNLTSADTSVVCVGNGIVVLEDILNVKSNPSGGKYSFLLGNISVSNVINLEDYNVSVLPVTIIYHLNQCEVRDSAFIQFVAKPELKITADTTLCIFDSLFTLSANVMGGLWSGPGVNPNTGIINLKNAGEGLKKYTYSFQPNTSCAQKLSLDINIINPGINLTAGPNQETCEGTKFFTLSGNSPANGIWSGVAIDPISGNIDVTQLTLDSLYTYTYCLTDASIQGCQACKSKYFIVHSLPVPSFDIEGLTCINEDVTIINQTLGNNTIMFNLGDGSTSISNSVIHQYSNEGVYTITLQVTNQFKCSSSVSKDIYVTTRPISAFTLSNHEGCAPLELIISNQSSGDNISYEWNINNRIYTDITLPPVILDDITKDSVFIITLAVTNQCGTVSLEDTVRVHPYPRVNFGISEQSGCSPLTVHFANISSGNPATSFWDMGNGNLYFDTIPPPQIYTTAADQITTYDILYIGTNMCGTDSLIRKVTIYPPDVTAFIESPGLSLCQYDTLVLSAFSTPGAINTWKLIAPDGSLSGFSGDLAIIEMSQAGTYTAILFANRCGMDSDTVKVKVLPAPFLDFELPPYACVGSSVNFTNSGTEIGSVSWDYGDGNINSSGFHTYHSTGIYTVTLTGYSLINNCPYSVSKTIRIVGLPTASFVPSVRSGCEPLEISFENNSTPGSNFDWNFGDKTSNSYEQNPTHIFLKDGIFQVKLTVYDSFGCFTDTSVLNIIVHPKPVSKFSFPLHKYCHRFDSIPFVNISTGSAGQEWILENVKFNTQNLTWLPSDSGKFNVTLVAISIFGCIDSSSSIIDILPSPTSNFIVDNDSGCEDLTVNFKNLSTSANHYIWDLKNGTTSVDKDLKYTFYTPGSYDVSLTSFTKNDCPSDTYTKTIIVYPKPKADFDIQKDSVCGAPMYVNFLNNSIGNPDNHWYVNDIEKSQDPTFAYVFDSAATYDIALIVQNEYLCSDTLHKPIDIYLKPLADFDIREQACEGDTLTIINKSINSFSYIWEIENIGISTIANPELVFEKSGTYHIKLISIYNEFCKDTVSLSKPIRIYDSPVADFKYEGDYDDNILGEIKFSNLSIDYNRSLWDFGDGNMSEEDSPSHEYDVNRNLLVKLIVYNDNDGQFTCKDSIVKPVAPEWITTFFAPNALSPEYGEGDVSVFKPVGIGLAKYKISIYSPWGQTVWTSDKLENTSPSEVWDGTFKNTIVPQGAYSWVADVTFVNGIRRIYKGSVTVVR